MHFKSKHTELRARVRFERLRAFYERNARGRGENAQSVRAAKRSFIRIPYMRALCGYYMFVIHADGT